MRVPMAWILLVALAGTSGCTDQPASRSAPASPSAPTRSSWPRPSSAVNLTCAESIGAQPSLTGSQREVLGALGLQTATTLALSQDGGSAPHTLFAKTGLLIRAGRASTLSVPPAWVGRVAIAWGNHAAVWTSRISIPACDQNGGAGEWLAFPGGFSVDAAACVPLEVRSGGKAEVVRVSVGTRCPR